jgi:hypothetical protein
MFIEIFMHKYDVAGERTGESENHKVEQVENDRTDTSRKGHFVINLVVFMVLVYRT